MTTKQLHNRGNAPSCGSDDFSGWNDLCCHFIHAGREFGPLTLQGLFEAAHAGELDRDDLVKTGGGLWKKAHDIFEPWVFPGAARSSNEQDAAPGKTLRLEDHPPSEARTATGLEVARRGPDRVKQLAPIVGGVIVTALVVGFIVAAGISASRDLTGTVWHGSESLQGFGDLTFEFHKNGVVLMTDAMFHAKGKVAGKWARSGSEVTITFLNCEYRGLVDGAAYRGTAHSVQFDRAWTFTVRRH